MTVITEEKEESSLNDQINETNQKLLKFVEQIEALVLTERIKPSKAIEELSRLSNFVESKPHNKVLELHSAITQSFCTRVAQIYCRLFCDSSWSLDLLDLTRLMLQKRFISYCFELSGFWSNQFLVDILQKKADAVRKSGKDFANNQAAIRLISLSGITQLEAETLVDLTLKESEVSAVLTIGLLLDVLPITLTGESNRRFLLESFDPFEKLAAHQWYSMAVSNVWMLCSYSSSPKKHLIKERLNRWYRRMHTQYQLKIPKPGSIKEPKNTQSKPVLAVVAERFTSIHAIYRWYEKSIKKLRQDFFVVLVTMKSDCDETSRELFDRCVLFDNDTLNHQAVLDQCAPDVTYYPSIGMRAWAISMANLRWGTLQMMSHGHPATSNSDCIDGVFASTATFAGVDVCSENQLILRSHNNNTISALQDITIPEPIELKNDVIQIAIPCNAMKINLQFMAALKEIEKQAQTPIRFTFFPNVIGLSYLSTKHRIQTMFPDAIVAHSYLYQQYINELNKFHFAISPFPFGNASSTIDCLLVGLPVLSMIGKEPHSRTDFQILAAFELEDFCVADSGETYVQGAVSWIDNPPMLKQLRDLIASKNIVNDHIAQEDENEDALSNEFCQAMKWAWENREFMRNNRQQAIEAEGNWA